MQQNKLNILSTRPLDEAIMQQAKTSNLIIDIISFIEINFLHSPELTTKIQLLAEENITAVFTSMNAIEAIAANVSASTPWKIYCMGNTTKKAIKKYFGYGAISAIASNANELSQKIIAAKEKHVSFFCGNKRLEELPEKLQQHEIELTEITVYETVETPKLVNKNYDGILFFSPSGVESFFLNNTITNETILFSIGNTTASIIKKYSLNKIIVSDKPGKELLLKKVIEYFETKKIQS